MNEQRISKFVNDLFYDVVENDKVREQKEELRIHVTERIHDYMAAGLSFDEAFDAAKDGLGDPEELISGFERKRAIVLDDLDDEYGVHIQVRFKRLMFKLVPLAPFIYAILGITQSHWQPEWWTWGWWMWGWVIIPMIAIMSSGIGTHTITALSPFIYVLLGVFFGWWLWGWLIIPVSAILFSNNMGRRKRKKKKKWKSKDTDSIIEIKKGGKKIIIDKYTGSVEIEKDGKVIYVNSNTNRAEDDGEAYRNN